MDTDCACHDACDGYYGGADCNASTATYLDAFAGADALAAADAATAHGEARNRVIRALLDLDGCECDAAAFAACTGNPMHCTPADSDRRRDYGAEHRDPTGGDGRDRSSEG